jgi:hypothetical protein
VLDRLLEAARRDFDVDDYDYGIPLVSAARAGSDLLLTFRAPSEGASIDVTCRGHLSHRVSIGWCSPELLDDHPLLWARTERSVEVYFHGVPRDAAAVEASLARAHAEITEGWIDYERNTGAPLEGGHGLLAKAPARVAEAYLRVLSTAGVEANTISREVSLGRHRGDDPWEPVGGVPRLLLLDSAARTYVLATEFEELWRDA